MGQGSEGEPIAAAQLPLLWRASAFPDPLMLYYIRLIAPSAGRCCCRSPGLAALQDRGAGVHRRAARRGLQVGAHPCMPASAAACSIRCFICEPGSMQHALLHPTRIHGRAVSRVHANSSPVQRLEQNAPSALTPPPTLRFPTQNELPMLLGQQQRQLCS